jgi:hypothetical protein
MNHMPRSRLPEVMLPRFNPEVDPACPVCRSNRPVEYVAVKTGDHTRHAGLALFMQDAMCRRFAHYRLHRRIDAAFMDTPGTKRTGLNRLLAHLALCHNRLLITSRPDRLPTSQTRKLGDLAVRVVSASDSSTRNHPSQAEMIPHIQTTIRQMFKQADKKSKGGQQ